ncbi:MAG: c-type cytochrome [Deltaproteobacteria bacterium]|nr:c-type cytochrome [Deltaproteobacteria bacterium]
MIEFLYQTLAKFGYTHPLHPTLTHLPIGMVMGAFIFVLVALIFRRTGPAQTARHCVILGLLAAIPAALLGIMDWLHFYGGSMLLPFKMKLILAVILISFLLLAVILGFFGERFQKKIFTLYVLCLMTTIGLGYFGGEIVYGKRAPEGAEPEELAAKGAAIFEQNCSACHLTDSTATKIGPGLKGLFKRDKFPISGRPITEDNFRSLLKKPIAKMPPFGHLPNEEVDDLIEYLKTL